MANVSITEWIGGRLYSWLTGDVNPKVPSMNQHFARWGNLSEQDEIGVDNYAPIL